MSVISVTRVTRPLVGRIGGTLHDDAVRCADAYSEPFRPPIPGEAVHPFRGKPTTDSDGKPSTFEGAPESVDGIAERVDGMLRNRWTECRNRLIWRGGDAGQQPLKSLLSSWKEVTNGGGKVVHAQNFRSAATQTRTGAVQPDDRPRMLDLPFDSLGQALGADPAGRLPDAHQGLSDLIVVAPRPARRPPLGRRRAVERPDRMLARVAGRRRELIQNLELFNPPRRLVTLGRLLQQFSP